MDNLAFEDKDIQYAYRSIHDFFDGYHLGSAIKETEKIIKAAASYKAWLTNEPYRPIYFMEQFYGLIQAAYMVTKNYSARTACVLKEPVNGHPNLLLTQNYVSIYQSCTPWNNIPRHLTAAQYHDPYIAIEKFTKYATEIEWKEACKDLSEYALTNDSIDEEYPCYKLLPIRLHILRLIEACHLLEVRSTAAKPKPKSPKKK